MGMHRECSEHWHRWRWGWTMLWTSVFAFRWRMSVHEHPRWWRWKETSGEEVWWWHSSTHKRSSLRRWHPRCVEWMRRHCVWITTRLEVLQRVIAHLGMTARSLIAVGDVRHDGSLTLEHLTPALMTSALVGLLGLFEETRRDARFIVLAVLLTLLPGFLSYRSFIPVHFIADHLVDCVLLFTKLRG